MFSKETYVNRRNELKKLVKSGIIILFGNNESPNNYPNNVYYPFRQDSSFLYYFGLQRDGLVGVIDVDNDTETLIGNDIDIEDIVWYGSVDSVHDLAAQVGISASSTADYRQNGRYTSSLPIAMTSSCRCSTCSASIPTSRRSLPRWSSSRLW